MAGLGGAPMDVMLEELLHSPKLALYVDKFQRVLEAEHKRRTQFYDQMKEDQKTEFINGEVLVHSPVKLRHNTVTRRLLMLMSAYVQKYDLGLVGYEKILITLTRNDYEPDICFFDKEKSQFFTPDQMQFPAPDFIVEVLSPSTAANDRGIKHTDYAAHGVTEYWIIDPDALFVEQYLLDGDDYELARKTDSGQIASRVIAGFELPVDALFDDAQQWRTLQKIMQNE
ncbi:MAG: Uma2 family endonuclease [Chloroflexi bacterium]|nr:Uma2 family endonuclease [Chloroflexota bacterium]